MDHLPLFKRCLYCIAAQDDVQVHLAVALQDFTTEQIAEVDDLITRCFYRTGFSHQLINTPNPEGKDLRSVLLNTLVAHHYDMGASDYLSFIDYDDIWFQSALATLVEPLQLGSFALSYADIHCADVFYDAGQTYLRDIRDIFVIHGKTKRHFLQDNFLPLHSYMFHTGRIARQHLRYDETLVRLEDYDVLLHIARQYPVAALNRKRLIGLYNFYTNKSTQMNTSRNVFLPTSEDSRDLLWDQARRLVINRHGGAPWHEFTGEEWVL